MAVRIRSKVFRSPLDPITGRYLASVEIGRMTDWLRWCRENEQRVTFLTLTYDPRPYECEENPSRSCFHDSRRLKHLPKFMQRLSDLAGKDLKGLWRSKLEFQPGTGMPHYHILIRDLGFVDQRDVQDAWGHGIVDIREAREEHAAYIAKYQAKGSTGPDWLYDEPVRSVKIWSTSPGFFTSTIDFPEDGLDEPDLSMPVRINTERKAMSESLEGDDDAVVTYRDAIDRARSILVAVDDAGNKIQSKIPISSVGLLLSFYGCSFQGGKWGWYEYDATLQDVNRAIVEASSLHRAMQADDAWLRHVGDYGEEGPTNPEGLSDRKSVV